MPDSDGKPTQAELDAEETAAKEKFGELFKENFAEAMTTWQTEQDRKKAEAEKNNPPKTNGEGGAPSSGTRRVNALQKLLNL